MAKEEEKKEGAGDSSEGKSKLLLGGGLAAVVAAGAIAALMALPSTDKKPRLVGPFAITLFEAPFTCNLMPDQTRFLRMSPQADYYAYDRAYLSSRVLDELYPAALEDAVFSIAARKTKDDFYGEVDSATFAEELRDALDPILFPIHIGDSKLPWDFDESSGLRPGMSSNKNTFRGRFQDHILHVDSEQGEMWVDDGPKSSFEAGEFDVRLITVEGAIVYVDASEMTEDFSGEVKIGAHGRILRIIPTGLIVQ